jgi:hypothetical protein
MRVMLTLRAKIVKNVLSNGTRGAKSKLGRFVLMVKQWCGAGLLRICPISRRFPVVVPQQPSEMFRAVHFL